MPCMNCGNSGYVTYTKMPDISVGMFSLGTAPPPSIPMKKFIGACDMCAYGKDYLNRLLEDGPVFDKRVLPKDYQREEFDI